MWVLLVLIVLKEVRFLDFLGEENAQEQRVVSADVGKK